MFSYIRNFVYRHKNKLLIGSGLIGSVILLSKYAEYKLHQWHDNETQLIIKKQKKRQHYEKTKETANATVLSLSNSISKIISDELDTDSILQAIQSQPHNKKILWEDLKLVGFGRCIASVYTASLIGTFVYVHLMLLGSYTYADVKRTQGAVNVTLRVQEEYLSLLQNLVMVGLPTLFKKIMRAVKCIVHPFSLNKKVSVEALEGILKDIILLLEGEENAAFTRTKDQDTYRLSPWSQYVKELKKTNSDNLEDNTLHNMTEELIDIVNAEDFNIVMHSLINQGLNYVLDYVTNFYPQQHISVCNVPSNKASSAAEAIDSSGAKPKQLAAVAMNISEALVDKSNDLILNDSSFKETLPLAKVIPILSGIVHSAISPAPGHLLQSVLLNEKLENFSFNVYEAFSVSL